jgi:protein TonB
MAHAMLIGMLPGYASRAVPAPVALEVTIVKPEPLPVAPPAPEPRRERLVTRRSEPPRRERPPERPAQAPEAQQPQREVPVLALPAPQAPAENAFTVPPARKPAEPSPAPAQKPQVASATSTPPAFNAAYLRNPAPRYPLVSRRLGEQGTVLLRVLVTPDGLPARVDLEKTSGSVHLDAAAMEAVKGWSFTPARRGNEAIEGWVLVPIVFRLEG